MTPWARVILALLGMAAMLLSVYNRPRRGALIAIGSTTVYLTRPLRLLSACGGLATGCIMLPAGANHGPAVSVAPRRLV